MAAAGYHTHPEISFTIDALLLYHKPNNQTLYTGIEETKAAIVKV